MWKLFKGVNYSRAETIHGNTVLASGTFFSNFCGLLRKAKLYRAVEGLKIRRIRGASSTTKPFAIEGFASNDVKMGMGGNRPSPVSDDPAIEF